MNGRSIEDEKAVTIVALTVTIIVIILLSVVTIGMALEKNGILAITKTATNEYNNAVKNEYQEINGDYIEWTGNNLVKMFKNGEIKVGDYVNYTIPETGEYITTAFGDENSNGFVTQRYDVDNNGKEINWRVLGLSNIDGKLTLNNSEGTNILLISGSPVQKYIDKESENEYDKNPYLFMGKAEGYENASTILNGICNIYLNEALAEDVRSINAQDINTLLEVIVDTKNNTIYKTNNEQTNIDILRTMGNSFSYNENTYSAESYATLRKNKTEGSVTSTGYSYLINEFKKSLIGNIIFSQTDRDSGYAKSYWLDTKSVDVGRVASYCIGKVYLNSINLGSGEFKSNGKWNVYGLGVYPIVILKSSITTDEIQIVNKNEETWNYKTNLCYSGDINNYETIGTEQKVFK